MLKDENLMRYELTSMETIMIYDLEKLIAKYEKEVFTSLFMRKYEQCEEVLMDLCLDLVALPEKEQLFTARVFFIGLITDILRIQTRKERLRPKALSHAFDVIYHIERWKNISEFMLKIHWLVEKLSTYVISDHLIFKGNKYVEEALSLIHHHLKSDYLNVNWLADQLSISTTHLSKLFKQYVGESISEYIAGKKINAILHSLSHSKNSLKHIRESYGFKSHSHFIQFFKKYTGITPLQYLQQQL